MGVICVPVVSLTFCPVFSLLFMRNEGIITGPGWCAPTYGSGSAGGRGTSRITVLYNIMILSRV
jgi:hypothetical protein